MDCKYPQPRSGKELKCFKPNKAGLCEGSFSFSLDGGGGANLTHHRPNINKERLHIFWTT